MRIKMVVGEIKELIATEKSYQWRNGFYYFIREVRWRLNEETGEVDLDDLSFASLRRLKGAGYKKRLIKLFGRTLGPDLSGPPLD